MDQDATVFTLCSAAVNDENHFNCEEINGLTPLNETFADLDENNSDTNSRNCSTPDIRYPENIGSHLEVMGIENTWVDDGFTSPPNSDYAIPLPAPTGFDDVSCLDAAQNTESGPFPETDLGMLFSNENETSDDVKDSSASPGVCGLRNLGNTCFMAAGLQCLAATPSLVQFFLSRNAAIKDDPHSLTDQFSLLIHKMWSGQWGVIRPFEFKQALGFNHPQFKDYRQHDCQEFLALLLDNLHEQLNTASNKSEHSDVSTAPATPHSQCETTDDRDSARKLVVEHIDPEIITQGTLTTDSMKSNHSSSSGSSDSSGEGRSLFRMQQIPEGVVPFQDTEPYTGDLVMEVTEDSVEHNYERSEGDKEDSSFVSNPNCSDSNSSYNIISHNSLKRNGKIPVAEKVLEKNVVASQLNNVAQGFRGLQDILKDAKTSNVNVLVTEEEANNELRFDSEKYPKHESARRRDPLENPNLTEFHNFDCKTVSVKRIKETNLLQETVESTSEYVVGYNLESSRCFNNIKRMKLEDTEKNFRMECERKMRDLDTTVAEVGSSAGHSEDAEVPSTSTSVALSDEIEADKHWDKHLSLNQSVIVDSFQGQFKSTVVCSSCKHVSVTYEPFMYLSVPLPHAMERQICVTFVSAANDKAVKYLLTLNKQERVVRLKEELLKCMGKDAPKHVALAEVLDSHIARILDENSFLRYVNDTNRSIYAFELLLPPCSQLVSTAIEKDETDKVTCMPDGSVERGDSATAALDLTESVVEEGCAGDLSVGLGGAFTSSVSQTTDTGDPLGPLTQEDFERLVSESSDTLISATAAKPHSTVLGLTAPVNEKGDGWKSCAICLEEMDSNLRRHVSCSCVLCESCIEASCKHYGGDTLNCPVCGVTVKPETEFIELDKLGDFKPTIRLLNVPVVFRLDTDGDGNNNKKKMRLFGHPNLIRLPNRLSGKELHDALHRLVPYKQPYSVLLVDGQGYHCSRCIYTVHCRGCRIESEGEVQLQTGDTLAVRFTDSAPEPEAPTVEHPSMATLRCQDPLSLYDCLHAFSESEQLDEHNPWYCPVCQKNQCATKTLSVWRYPDYLIVYLKRFIFHESMSMKLENKVTFPLSGLTVTSPYVLHHGVTLPYNLYACVCHFGGASAGHYTAYTKNPRTNEWHYYNDDIVTKQKPQEDDYSSAYILFYQKQGVSLELGIPKMMLSEESPKPNIEQLILELDSSVDQDWP
ncbi:uncharacterized protein LOC126092050 [Schistocerca cancellata]|uniref:uncharacterized protein LOC126092050 n=1 Tax=Schistocerca cancellata TaxID=274614 RepID=UPI002117CA63|nr:uncharacterized protein LOC126092050 [Schistocerca cancellata]XP_049763412.1 uncharacterized protein LOC126092050 [Schistocerca cancellata]XP_049763414.1 uncharacterized protein LOC126092050 [Schistocerca cancellata]